jgi:16S rRNA (adenine1518-N6/adenine1519-N6)-dimethyltransferase
MLTKTQIVELSKKNDFYLKKSLGQNFLIDRNLRDKIIRLLGLNKGDTVLEIGPGLGALTEALAENCKYVCAVEKDRKLYGLAREILSSSKNLEIIHSDFLDFDIGSLLRDNIKVVGALPFYITTPILEHLLNSRTKISSIFIIVQKEVAKRLIARAGENDYSSLSLFIQFFCEIEELLDIKKTVFFPQPKVDATLVKLDILPRPRLTLKDEETLFKVIRQAFSQRRKTLLSSLSQKGILGLSKDEIGRVLDDLGIDSKRRPETLTLGQFAGIADAIVDFLR